MWSKRCRRTCNRSMMIDMWATCVALHATRACGQKCERTWRHLACDPGHATSHVEHEGRFCSSEDQISSVQTSPRGYSLKIGPVQSSRQYWVSAKSSSINKLFIGIEHLLHNQNENKETRKDTEKEEAPTTPKTNGKTKGASNKRIRETEPESPSSPPPAPKKRVDMMSWGPKRDTPNEIRNQTERKVGVDITIAIRNLGDLDRVPSPQYNKPETKDHFKKIPNHKRTNDQSPGTPRETDNPSNSEKRQHANA
ncbi:hypothetical protein F2Q70_00011549 [Brassica cretica]|uniref:Uncharacterized protein n=1 Tax=Brassica cretica TaxID=69181 RepID=A0A8S9LVV7_BRACR|nr:hypothetical protein F2Q70_00011549 [Brassica cretica]